VGPAVDDARMNIMQHGYAMDPKGRIEVVISLEKDVLVFRLRDYATANMPTQLNRGDSTTFAPAGLACISFAL
jgi:anti-sigma regulatory factor (Ser/Thr protein kinase)